MIDTESALTDVLTSIECKNGQLLVKRTQDVEPILEANKREFVEANSWRPYAGVNMKKVASIPNVVAEQWLREGVNVFDPSPEMQKKVAQKLNSNEWLHLRTCPGRVGYRT